MNVRAADETERDDVLLAMLDRHAVMAGVIRRIDAASANQRVVAESTIENVAAPPTIEHVVELVADDRVDRARADHVLDAGQRVGVEIKRQRAALQLELVADSIGATESEMHLHPVGGVAGIEKVVARIVHRVGAVHAVEDVEAKPPGQQVVERVAGQPVADARTDQALDGGELVAGRVAATRQRGLRVAIDAGEPHGHRRRRGLVAGEVEASPAR